MTKPKKILIVGGVAGGATAAARMRRLDQEAEIILFERGEYISYANCGLPYYIGGVIEERENLFVTTKEYFSARYNLDIRPLNEVLSIDREAKEVVVKDIAAAKEYRESYDYLVLATGSSPIVPNLPGIKGENVFTLWTIPDTDRIYNYINEKKVERAVVIGGGFIGLEVAENLVERGLKVSIVEKLPQIMAVYDPDMAMILENDLRDHGVELLLGKALVSIAEDGKSLSLDSGETIATDMIVLSIGTRPNGMLAKEAGLEMNQRGGVIVDDYMQTSDPFIFAVGDMIEVNDFNTGLKTMVPLAGPANKQGRIVADNIHKPKTSRYQGTQGTSIVKLFDLSAAVTGLNENALQRLGKKYREDYLIALAHPNAHAGYYPGALPLTIKLIFDLKGKVLGAQAVGYDGVDKRIDVLATAIRLGATVFDLENLELAYAPPFSSAKDPVNVVGYMAKNQLEGLSDAFLVRELDQLSPDMQLLDVREAEETYIGNIPGAQFITLTELREGMSRLDPSKTYILHCASGLRSYIAERMLKEAGFKAKNLLGGFHTYSDAQPRGTRGDYCAVQDTDKYEEVNAAAADVMQVDACGLACPGPIMSVNKAMQTRADGERVKVLATDPGFSRDIASWCENTGNVLIEQGKEGNKFTALIQKGQLLCDAVHTDTLCVKEKTMIIFSGDLDKAIAAFIIANGAAAMGNQVNMFFTFWGLNILRKPKKMQIKKSFMGKMFSSMMPRGSKKLGLSRMNFAGAGAKMIRSVMKNNNISSLEDLIADAIKSGVKITACQMSMDLMGITFDELVDGVEISGVAAMLNDNDHSNMNLFI